MKNWLLLQMDIIQLKFNFLNKVLFTFGISFDFLLKSMVIEFDNEHKAFYYKTNDEEYGQLGQRYLSKDEPDNILNIKCNCFTE